MEKPKLPFYLKIENDSRIRFMSYRTRNFFLSVFGFFLFSGIGYYVIVNLHMFRDYVRPFLSIGSVLLVLMFMIAIIYSFTLERLVELRKDGFFFKSGKFFFIYEREIARENIASIRLETSTQTVDTVTLSGKVVPEDEDTHTIIATMVDGEWLKLFTGFEDIAHAHHICRFINGYYGLDEKPKTNHQ